MITLEADTDYQFKVDAACESGTIEISLTYENAEEECISSILLLHVTIKSSFLQIQLKQLALNYH